MKVISNIIMDAIEKDAGPIPAYVIDSIKDDVLNIIYEMLSVELGKTEGKYNLADCNEATNIMLAEISAGLGDIGSIKINNNCLTLINKVANTIYTAAMKERGLA